MSYPVSSELIGLMAKEVAPIDFVLPGFKLGSVGALISPGGLGKSWWVLQVAVAMASESNPNWSNLPLKQGKILFLSGEDPEDIIVRRLLDLKEFSREKRLSLADIDYRDCFGRNLDLMSEITFKWLVKQAQGVRLIVLDTLSRFHRLDENSAAAMKDLVAQLELLARDTGASVLYLHHTNKSTSLAGQGSAQQAARGSSVLVDNARWAAYLMGMSEADARRFGVHPSDRGSFVCWNISKQNYGAPLADQWYRREEGGVLNPVELIAIRDSATNRKGPGTQGELALEDTPALTSAKNLYEGRW